MPILRQWFKIGALGPFELERLVLPFQSDRPGEVGQIVASLFYTRKYDGPSRKAAVSQWRHLLASS